MNKLDFILRFGHFYKDPLGNIGCSDEHIVGYYNKNLTVGKNKEEAAAALVEFYDRMLNEDNKNLKRDLWAIGWSKEPVIELSSDKIKNIYLSIISSSSWLSTQSTLAPIGREYLFKEFLPTHSWAGFYKKYFSKTPSDYSELFRDIRTLEDDSTFEFENYTKADCIREGFFQVYSLKSIDELKALTVQIRQI